MTEITAMVSLGILYGPW